jgi:hypothetical protein
MPQTAQYPKEIPNTKATTIVNSNRNDSRNGVISLSFYRKTGGFCPSEPGSTALGLSQARSNSDNRYFTAR